MFELNYWVKIFNWFGTITNIDSVLEKFAEIQNLRSVFTAGDIKKLTQHKMLTLRKNFALFQYPERHEYSYSNEFYY